MDYFYKKGITMLEILIVASIVTIIILITLPQFSKIKENQILKNATAEVVSAIHTAQSQSLASLNSSEYGIHFEADQIVIFTGQNYSAIDPENKIIKINPATISNVTLNGVSANSGELYFQRLSGFPNKNGTITISNIFTSKIITISSTGTVSLN